MPVGEVGEGGPMRIALVSYEYPPETGFGGVGTYTWYQARALARLGHEVRVVAGSLRPGVFHEEHDGVKVTRVLDTDHVAGLMDGLHHKGAGWAAVRLGNAMGAYLVLRDLLEHESFDIVEFPECGADGMIASTLLPIRTSVRFHSPANLIMESYGILETYGGGARDIETATFVEQIAVNRAAVRISPTRFLAGVFEDRFHVRPPVHVVRNGLDLDLFDREGVDVASRFGLPPRGQATTVLFSGRLERRKGADLLPGICSRLLQMYPHVRVVIAGADSAGTFANEILPRAQDLGVADRLHHLGALSLAEVRGLVKWADIHLHPSMWDNAPYSCIEAMAAGCAVVSSDVGGLPELVDHRRNGLVAPAGDESAFVAALQELVEDPALRERLGAQARLTVERRHTDVAMALASVAVWQDCIALGSGSGVAPIGSLPGSVMVAPDEPAARP